MYLHKCVTYVLRIKRIKFDFTLGAFYHTNIIENDNAVDAKFDMEINLDNELHSGHIHVGTSLVPTLRRVCHGGLRRYTVLDGVVFILLVSATITYILSICVTIQLARVCMQLYIYSIAMLYSFC